MNKNKTILFIEDITDTIDGTLTLLEYHGYIIFPAASINSARNLLKKKKFDAIFLDWWIPEQEGSKILENGGGILLKNLREGKYGKLNAKTPIIIYTAHFDRFDKDRILYEKLFDNFKSKLDPINDVVTSLEDLLDKGDRQ